MSDSGWRPTQARKILVKAARCLAKALITGAPGGVNGALGDQHVYQAGFEQTHFQHVTQDAEYAVETLVVFGIGLITTGHLPLNTSHHLGNNHQIDDQRRRQKGIFANIEQADGLMSAHENLCVVLVQRPLVVTYRRHILDHDGVVGMLPRPVQHIVGLNHVVHDIGLGDFLGAKLPVRAQVLTVIVTQMVVAGNGGELDTGVDHEIHQSRLHLGLSRLKVVPTDESAMLLREVDYSRDKSILGGSVDERSVLQNTSDGKNR